MSSTMGSRISSSSRCSSSASYRSSSCYSTSSSYRLDGSTGGSGDPLDPLLESFLDPADPGALFGEEGPRGPGGPYSLAPFSQHRASCGHTGGAVAGCQTSMGPVSVLGDCYYMSADVSRFDPHDIVVMAYNHHIVIHAEKVLEDGSINNTFTHKSLLPEDMDPLTVSGTITDGILLVSVRQRPLLGVLEPLGATV